MTINEVCICNRIPWLPALVTTNNYGHFSDFHLTKIILTTANMECFQYSLAAAWRRLSNMEVSLALSPQISPTSATSVLWLAALTLGGDNRICKSVYEQPVSLRSRPFEDMNRDAYLNTWDHSHYASNIVCSIFIWNSLHVSTTVDSIFNEYNVKPRITKLHIQFSSFFNMIQFYICLFTIKGCINMYYYYYHIFELQIGFHSVHIWYLQHVQ